MRVFTGIPQWRAERAAQARAGHTLGFVPTMGALHEGHLSLIRRSRAENDRTLVSIFVNPTQFDDSVDLANYPRPTETDLDLLRSERVDAVLLPSPGQIYPHGNRYRVSEHAEALILEGAARPGHFVGVLTVVLKLLHIAEADRAYFGEKDWQQLRLIAGMAEDFFLRTAIIGCPIVREPSGLAMSSRNVRLTSGDRAKAALLYRALSTGSTAGDARRVLDSAGFVVDYVAEHDGRRLAAVRLGDVRLIDNVPLKDHP